MNERLYPLYQEAAAADNQSDDCQAVMTSDAALKHISGGQINGDFRKCSVRAKDSGQTMVEFALILPIFLVFVFAIIEMGRAWGAKHSLTIAAREGARILALPYGPAPTYKYASVEDAQSAAIATVKDSMNSSGTPAVESIAQITAVRLNPGGDGIFNTEDDRIELYNTVPTVTRGDRVGIYIKYKFETPAPILLGMFNDTQRNDGGPSAPQDGINMGVICFMGHE